MYSPNGKLQTRVTLPKDCTLSKDYALSKDYLDGLEERCKKKR